MDNKALFPILAVVISLAILSFFFIFNNNSKESTSDQSLIKGVQEAEEKINIALCPTYHYLSQRLEDMGYLVTKTNSTAESLEILRNEKSSFAIAGRTPYSSEADLAYFLVDTPDRYSFLHKESITLNSNELANMRIYTDEDPSSLEKIFGIRDAIVVDDVYSHIDEDIIVTSWDNTDYAKASIVHVMDDERNRNINSRAIVVYGNEKQAVNELAGKIDFSNN